MATDLDPEKQAQFGLRRTQQQPAQPQPQLGMTLAPDQQRRQRIDADMQRASERIRETKQGLTKVASTAGDAIGSAYGTVLKAGTAVPRGLYGIATGETPVTFSSELPDYTNRGLDRRRAGNFVKDNPEQAEAARLGLRSVADRASSSAIGAVKAAQPTPAAAAAPRIGLAKPSAAADAGNGQQDAAMPVDAAAAVAGAEPRLGFQRTGVDGVVGRVGANGTMEFSNDAGDVAGAADTQLRAGRMGNGVGGLSVGEAGDSQMALERFQRANDIRAQAIADGRRGDIGEHGGLVVVGDGGSGMDRARDRREASIAGPQYAGGLRRLELGRGDQQLQAAGLGLRRDELASQERSEAARLASQERSDAGAQALREREVANAETTSNLEQQRLNMELQTGELALAQQQRIEQLRTQLADPNLDPAARAQLERTYNTLSTPAKDRYMLQDSVMGYDALGAPIFGKAALDVATGQMVGQGGQQQAARPQQFEKGKIYRDGSGARARFTGTDAQGNPQWEVL